MNYRQTTEYLFGLQRFGSKLDLINITKLLELVGNPQRQFKSVHVGGTSGKFSVVQMTAAILQASGYKVGTFISPHLSRYTERFCINGKEIDETAVIKLTSQLKVAADKMVALPDFRHPTFFEMSTALAFLYFAQQEIDVAVVEVGMGGRLDATNVLEPLVSVITHVDLEHTHVLGETIEAIAGEKAGIVKKGGILVTGERNEQTLNVFRKACWQREADFLALDNDFTVKIGRQDLAGQEFSLKFNEQRYNLSTPLLGNVQIKNAALAVVTALVLRDKNYKISEVAIKAGLKAVKCPGRLEIAQKNPYVVFDCAKDPGAILELSKTIEHFFYFSRLILVMAVSDDKNIKQMAKNIAPLADLVIATRHGVKERALDPRIIQKEFIVCGVDSIVADDVKMAVAESLDQANVDDLILVTGSVFTVGEARDVWYDEVRSK
ncbi:bifunctional folylpolyglutamate synthase/dihydrofolate synthase [Patescibacteria group bacterium]|nr:bifunctional folylpolyglutamate synthase/dihydrofolate synthase [Patescibacteria group bacterium]